MKRVHLVISGEVQGVGFRSWAKNQAEELELTGWVKNRDDATVEVIAEGFEDKLEEFLSRCRDGPDVAWVEDVQTTWEENLDEFDSFEISR